MKRIALASSFMLVMVVLTRWSGYAQQDDSRFTGRTDVLESKELGISRRSFEPGARSAWHSHDKGQLLFVEEGRARTQKKDQPIKELGIGDSEYTGPHVVHWHGAVPNQRLVQIAVSFGGDTKWMQKTTDAEYAGK
jgi:quercetin dioxygenase-like cupin family protein